MSVLSPKMKIDQMSQKFTQLSTYRPFYLEKGPYVLPLLGMVL